MTALLLTPTQRQAAARYGLPLALAAALLYLIVRNTGAYPGVFADEWLYSKFSRLLPLSASELPSYLYLKLFSLSDACGPGFLQCARVFNAALFVGAAPFIYLLARPLAGRPAAAVIALLATLSPASVYTAYFMPESSYYFGFWALSYALLRADALRPQWRATLGYGLLAGVLLGLLALVKVHALFLLPSLCLFIVYQRHAAGARGALAQGAAAALLAAAAALAVKLALAYALAGPVGLSLLGSFYSGQARGGHDLARLLAPAGHSLLGHAMGLLVAFAFPLLMLGAAAASGAIRAALGPRGRALLLYTLLMLGAAAAMTVAFTATLADGGPQELDRLHLRYYNFTFPLLLIAATAVAAHGARAGLRLRAALALLLAPLLLAATVMLPRMFHPSAVDCPELFSMLASRPLYYLLAALEAALVALWVLRPQRAAPLYLMALAPLFALVGEAANTVLTQRMQTPNAFDRAGRMAHDYLAPAERAHLSIAGDQLAGLMRAQFHVDDAHSAIIELQPGAPFEAAQTPVRQHWLLVVGEHALPADWQPALAGDGYALVRLQHNGRSLYQLAMSKPLAGGRLQRVEGLADPEDWGSWSNAKTVRLHFSEPLPARLTVLLNGRAFGPNAGQPFVMRVGGASERFKLPATTQELFLHFDTDGAQRELSIEIPQPTSPQQLGAGADVRLLGLGLIGLEIGEAAPR